ncbi:hypothetical protein IQ254_21220 [Nodosilinea sp. LEGE 07088]|uniref:hypothetical protein n=1 Tax=Nodosilinea sp. LEGE 07088 TaxID=2777968 RepID=UPI00187FBDDD|nr:hypothetical protein [Nodosilinea sp. LEGE 07088]MBE9139686.1 hypothetical protein [Nodosilinea sp. LEGE 07088]
MSPVTPGWKIIDQAGGVLTHAYEFAQGSFATTFAARMGNGQMLIVSPCIGLTEALCAELETYGDVGAIAANNGFHYMGQREWRERFPNARCFAPADALKRIAQKAPEAGDFEPLSALAEIAGPRIQFREVVDTKIGESWFWVKIDPGYVWYVSDVLINLPTLPSALVPRMLFNVTGSAPGFRVFNLMLKMSVRNKAATLRQLLEDIANYPPTVIVPAHGAILSHDTVALDAQTVVQQAL